MLDVITLTCPTCGAKLKITDQIHLLVCAHCGNEHFVHRDGGAIYLAPLAQDVRHIRVGVDKTAAELAVARLTKEIAELDNRLDAVKAMPDKDWVNGSDPSTVFAILFLLLLGIGLIAIANGNGQWATILLVAAVLCCGCFMMLDRKRLHKIKVLRQTEIDRINAELHTKHEQLRKNRSIVES